MADGTLQATYSFEILYHIETKLYACTSVSKII